MGPASFLDNDDREYGSRRSPGRRMLPFQTHCTIPHSLTPALPLALYRAKATGDIMFKDLFSLKGRIAVVTGGSRGIGKMIASGFLSQGAAKVYITARKAGPCEETAKELTAAYDGECIALPIDISTNAGCDLLAAEITKRE